MVGRRVRGKKLLGGKMSHERGVRWEDTIG